MLTGYDHSSRNPNKNGIAHIWLSGFKSFGKPDMASQNDAIRYIDLSSYIAPIEMAFGSEGLIVALLVGALTCYDLRKMRE